MDTLAIWGRPPRLDSPVRLSDSPSVCLSACVTDAILCHTYEQSTESRWANKFITCLNALTIHSVRTDVCVCVLVLMWVWARMFARCALGVFASCSRISTHIHIEFEFIVLTTT